jgi:hypothetical protein
MLLVMTRWHEDDLAGRILRDEGDGWTVLRLPALAEGDDPLGRVEGQALWPEQYDPRVLADRRRSVGAYTWAALYQGRPMPLSGGIFRREWLRYWRPVADGFVLPERVIPAAACQRFATVDLAASMSTRADYTVAAVWAVTDRRELLLLDLERARVEGPDHLALLRPSRASPPGLDRCGADGLPTHAGAAGPPRRAADP